RSFKRLLLAATTNLFRTLFGKTCNHFLKKKRQNSLPPLQKPTFREGWQSRRSLPKPWSEFSAGNNSIQCLLLSCSPLFKAHLLRLPRNVSKYCRPAYSRVRLKANISNNCVKRLIPSSFRTSVARRLPR